MLDYTGLGLEVEFPDKLKAGTSAAGRDFIDLSELDVGDIDEGSITSDEVQMK